MTRVAILTPYAPPVPGGISTFVSGLSHALTDDGHEVSLFAGEGTRNQTSVVNARAGRAYVRQVGSSLEKIRPDVVHCHSHWYCLAAGLRYLRRNPKVRLVFSFHTTPTPFLRIAFRRLLRRAHVVTFVSLAQLAELRTTFRLGGDNRLLRPAVKLRTVTSAEANQFASAYDLGGSSPILMFAGPLEYAEKVAGVVELVRAFRDLLTDYPDARLLIVGDGSLRSRVETEAKDLGESVRVTGFIDNVPAALANADLYCHVSRREGLPTALLEAMSLKRCVVASRVGGIPEVLDGSNGVLVESEAQSIATAIRNLLPNPNRRRDFGEAALRTVERNYTWAARLPQLYSIYGLAE